MGASTTPATAPATIAAGGTGGLNSVQLRAFAFMACTHLQSHGGLGSSLRHSAWYRCLQVPS
jgi:hypothetical protein